MNNRNTHYGHDRYGKFMSLRINANEPGFQAYAQPGQPQPTPVALAPIATPNVAPPAAAIPGQPDPNAIPGQPSNVQNNLPNVIDPFKVVPPVAAVPDPNAIPGGPQPATVPAVQPNAVRTPQEMLADYTKNLVFQMPEMSSEMQTAMQAGDFTGLNDHMQQFGRTVYSKMFNDFNQLVNSKVKTAMAEGVAQSGANADDAANIATMHSQLPWTAKVENAPLAKALFAKFMEGGSKTPSEAIILVDNYAKQLATSVGGMNTPPSGMPQGGFQGQGNFQPDETDWLEALGGQPLQPMV